MKAKKAFPSIAVAGLAVLLAAGVLFAGTEVADVIPMENPGYEKHTKGIVQFTHKKHYAEYGASCGDCHHDDSGQPLTDLKAGDDVAGCAECHSEFAFDPADKKMKKAEKIAKYHKEAIHANCLGCHRDFNKEKNLKSNDPKAAPATCSKCHPKNQ
jgi:hypothetical protein